MTKRIVALLMLLICCNSLFAQRDSLNRITDSIVTEGKALFHSEWASWYGTDVFLAKCATQKSRSSGYISYETNDGLVNIFFSTTPDLKVLATTTFGKDFDARNYKLDTTIRNFSKTENELYLIRSAALTFVNSDTTFKHYKNTGVNIVPLIRKGVKRVYILTSPKFNGVVIFGNDYLLNFNDKNQITSVKRLHKSIIPISAKADSGKSVSGTIHTHLPETGDFITATDICTLMLYEKFTSWQQHYVISKNDISIWDCKKDDLLILTMDAWKKIQADQKSSHPPNN